MATMITAECINCGACDPECPNTAIYQGGVEWLAPDGSMHAPLSNDIFYIVPEKCTECVGFFDQEACAKVCPVDCCVPNPDIPEAESLLLARARTLHPDKTIPDDAPSRFKAGGAESPAAAPAAAPTAPAAAPAAAAPVADGPTLSLPEIDEWEVPIQCFRCEGEYTVPFQYFRAGVVFYCPHCQGSLVPNLSMVRAVGDAFEFTPSQRAGEEVFNINRGFGVVRQFRRVLIALLQPLRPSAVLCPGCRRWHLVKPSC